MKMRKDLRNRYRFSAGSERVRELEMRRVVIPKK